MKFFEDWLWQCLVLGQHKTPAEVRELGGSQEDVASVALCMRWASFQYPVFRLSPDLGQELAETSNSMALDAVEWPFPAFLVTGSEGDDVLLGQIGLSDGDTGVLGVVVPKNRRPPAAGFGVVRGNGRFSVNEFVAASSQPEHVVRRALNLPFFFATQPPPEPRDEGLRVGSKKARQLSVRTYTLGIRKVDLGVRVQPSQACTPTGIKMRRHTVRGHFRSLPNGAAWVRPHFRGGRHEVRP